MFSGVARLTFPAEQLSRRVDGPRSFLDATLPEILLVTHWHQHEEYRIETIHRTRADGAQTPTC